MTAECWRWRPRWNRLAWMALITFLCWCAIKKLLTHSLHEPVIPRLVDFLEPIVPHRLLEPLDLCHLHSLNPLIWQCPSTESTPWILSPYPCSLGTSNLLTRALSTIELLTCASSNPWTVPLDSLNFLTCAPSVPRTPWSLPLGSTDPLTCLLGCWNPWDVVPLGLWNPLTCIPLSTRTPGTLFPLCSKPPWPVPSRVAPGALQLL